jgi:hypothetical protein
VELEVGLGLDVPACCATSTAWDVPLVDDPLVLKEGDPASDAEMRPGV